MRYKRLVDRLLSMQEKALGDPWVRSEAEDAEGRKTIIRVLGDAEYSLEVGGSRIKWADNPNNWIHRVTLSEDSFIDILNGSSDYEEEYMAGRIKWEGEKTYLHSKKVRDGLKRLRHLFSLLRG